MLHDIIVEPLLAGFSAGLFCCATCVPVLAPVFAAESRSAGANVRLWLQFLFGRLAGYILFGAAIGWLGEHFDAAWFTRISAAAMVVLSLLLISYAVGFRKPAWSCCAAGTRRGQATPVLLGFLMGANACPPVLMSVAYVFTLHSLAKGVVYFLVIFCATTVYLIPLPFVGLLGRMKEFRWAARASALAVGILYLVYGMMKA